jgi:hypothetical protein
MTRKSLTKADSAAYMQRRMDDTRSIKVGTAVWGKGRVPTTVKSISGDIATLATGESIHSSRLSVNHDFEAKHPRQPSGTPVGGEFRHKGSTPTVKPTSRKRK